MAAPVVSLVFERGAFTAEASAAVAGLLMVLCFGVPGWVVQQVAGRGFYAREDMWRPMFVSTGVALLAIPLYLGMGQRFGAEGIAAASSLAMSARFLPMVIAPQPPTEWMRTESEPSGSRLTSPLRGSARSLSPG